MDRYGQGSGFFGTTHGGRVLVERGGVGVGGDVVEAAGEVEVSEVLFDRPAELSADRAGGVADPSDLQSTTL